MAGEVESMDLKCLAFARLRDITPILDKRCLTDTVLEGLSKIAKKVSDGKLAMLVVETCAELGKMLGAETLAHRILPMLIPFMVSANVNRDQFESLMRIVK